MIIATIIMMMIAMKDSALGLTMMSRVEGGGGGGGEGVDEEDDKGDVETRTRTLRATM